MPDDKKKPPTRAPKATPKSDPQTSRIPHTWRDYQFWFGLVAVIVVFITSALWLNNKFNLDEARVGRVEGALKVMSDGMGNDTLSKQVHDLLAMAQQNAATDPQLAARATTAAAALVALRAKTLPPAEAGFFTNAVASINKVATVNPTVSPQTAPLNDAVRDARVQLADYRSALTVATEPHTTMTFTPMDHGIVVGPGNKFTGSEYDATNVRQSLFVTLPQRPGVPMTKIQETVIRNARQDLDGFDWWRVYFINSQITYKGGPLKMQEVYFVNCTFNVPATPDGGRVADYAALQSMELKVGADEVSASKAGD